jgi:hypothetical protein
MQWFWLIPSLGFGLVLGFTTGQWLSAAMAGFTALGLVAYFALNNRRVPTSSTDPVHLSIAGIAVGNQVLPKQSWRWKGEWVETVDKAVRGEHADWLAAQNLKQKVSGSLSPANSGPNSLSFWAGFESQRQIDFDLVSDGPHSVIIGATGSGKSQFLCLVIRSLLETYKPSQLALILIDFKGGSALQQFASVAHSLGLLTNQQEAATEFFQDLNQHMNRRQQQLAQLGLSRIEELPDSQSLPRILVCIDELVPVLEMPSALAEIDSVAARGRSLGIHLIVTAQSLGGFPRSLLTNLTLRFGIGQLDPIDAAQLGLGRTTSLGPKPPVRLLAADWQIAQYSGARGGGQFVFPSGGVIQQTSGF